MRMINIFLGLGADSRNDGLWLEDQHPVLRYRDDVTCGGDAGLAGFTVLSRAAPNREGDPPGVQGQLGRTYRGPSESFEQ